MIVVGGKKFFGGVETFIEDLETMAIGGLFGLWRRCEIGDGDFGTVTDGAVLQFFGQDGAVGMYPWWLGLRRSEGGPGGCRPVDRKECQRRVGGEEY